MEWITAHLAALEWTASHVGIPIFTAIVGFIAARLTDRAKRKADEQRASVQASMLLAEYARHWLDEFLRQDGRQTDQTKRVRWDAEIITSPLKDAKVAELVLGLGASARNALLELDERVPLYAAEIKELQLWQENDIDTDAPVILAEFILTADAVLRTVRRQAGIPSLPEDENGISYVRKWLPERKAWIRERNARRLVDQVPSISPAGRWNTRITAC